MTTELALGVVTVEVVRKDIRNLHLSVHPPSGRVRIAAPRRMADETIRLFAISKLSWIRAQQRKLLGQEREPPREYLARESHYVWGTRHLLEITEFDGPPQVALGHRKLHLRIRPGTDAAGRAEVVEAWYRRQLRAAVPELLARWEPVIGVKSAKVHVQRMKTRWGSSNPTARSIRLNTDLAKKPRECLEYVLVHELVHFLEPTHNERFVTLMDRCLPRWRFVRRILNQLPVRHEDWTL